MESFRGLTLEESRARRDSRRRMRRRRRLIALLLLGFGAAGAFGFKATGTDAETARSPAQEAVPETGAPAPKAATDAKKKGDARQARLAGARVTVAATGDIALGLADAGENPFTAVMPALSGDVVVGNLEGTLASGGVSKCRHVETPGTCFAFRAAPASAGILAEAGFTTLNVANNHAYDFGAEGFAETVAALEGAGLGVAGRPGEMALRKVGPVRLAVLGFAPYAWAQSLLDLAAAESLVRQAAREADLVAVTMHAGAEGPTSARVLPGAETYLGEARGDVVAFARSAVDAGADLVVGHGPHVLRGVEFYRGRLIAYSLGNFAGQRTLALSGPRGVSAILRVTLRGDGSWVRGRLSPVRLVEPGVPLPDEGGAALAAVRALSSDDFGESAPRIGPEGRIRSPGGVPREPVAPGKPGELLIVPGRGRPSGPGEPIRYAVEIEGGLPVDRTSVASHVERTLSDRRGWAGDGRLVFQRVGEGPVDFRVTLAGPALTDRLCVGLETRGTFSCYSGQRAVLNFARWRDGAAAYGADLRRYRTYMVNHEVGHLLGHGHADCPAAGAKAPLMMQQTKGVGACRPNPWPLPGER